MVYHKNDKLSNFTKEELMGLLNYTYKNKGLDYN